MRDHANIYHKLGFDYEFWRVDFYNVSKDFANYIWNEKKDYFNSFDYIVVSDTAPISRIFMENEKDVKSKVIVWICCRFDYDMEKDPSFYEIFKNISENNDKFMFIPYNEFEKVWCNLRGVTKLYKTITPIGFNDMSIEHKIDKLEYLKNFYVNDSKAKETFSDAEELSGKIVVSIYFNDNVFFDLKHILETNDIRCFSGGYTHPSDLTKSRGLLCFPDAFSKLSTFETIQHEVIVFLPSKEFLIKLHRSTNNGKSYWFNCPIGYLDDNLIKMCEWYKFPECRVYFDSIEDMIYKIKNITQDTIDEKKRWCRKYAEEIEKECMNEWSIIFS